MSFACLLKLILASFKLAFEISKFAFALAISSCLKPFSSLESFISFRFLGEISEIYKDEGNLVKAGDKLAELDKSYLLNKLDELKSQISLNEIKLILASFKLAFEISKFAFALAISSCLKPFSSLESFISYNEI